LWTGRSARRHLELLNVSLDDARSTAKILGGSLNDVFLTALTSGAAAYHAARGAPTSNFNASFVVSTRSDAAEGGNAFTPLRVQLPGTPMPPVARFHAIRERIGHQRAALSGGGLMGNFARVVNLLPTSVTTRVARSQAARLDFATSNIRGSGRPVYIAGKRVTQIFAPGPVAGSAMIVVLLSYLDRMGVLFTMDPAAVEDPAALRADVGTAFDELFAAARSVAAGSSATDPVAAAGKGGRKAREARAPSEDRETREKPDTRATQATSASSEKRETSSHG
jgi:hypothetical protein